jgi:hypothetical protein
MNKIKSMEVTTFLWSFHLIFFSIFALRYRIPIIVLPWFLLFLWHSYFVWISLPASLDKKLTEEEALLNRVKTLDLSKGEQDDIIDLFGRLRARQVLLIDHNISQKTTDVELRISEESSDELRTMLTEKLTLLRELDGELEQITLSKTLLLERIELLRLQKVQTQSSNARLEIRDIEESLKTQQHIQSIENLLTKYDLES